MATQGNAEACAGKEAAGESSFSESQLDLGVAPPSLADQIADLISIRDESATSLAEERQILEKERSALARKQASRLDAEAEVAQLHAKLASLEARQAADSCAMQKCRDEIAHTASIVQGLESELQALSKEEGTLTAILNTANRELLQAEAAAQAARDDHSQTPLAHQLRSMQAECATYASMVRQSEIQNSEAERQAAELAQKLADARASNRQLEDDITAVQQHVNEATVVALSQEQITHSSQSAAQARTPNACELEQQIMKLRQRETELQQELLEADKAFIEISTMHEALGCQ